MALSDIPSERPHRGTNYEGVTMLESGYYPPGAENDPRAPFNETDEGFCENCEWEQDECNCEAHYRFCAVNTTGKQCDCMEDW